MDRLVQFGRKAWFIVRVISGYEERRIRSYRLQLQKRLEMLCWHFGNINVEWAELPKLGRKSCGNSQKKLSEVRQVVQQMQALNQHLEEAETAIDEYFKPIDKNAKIITDMQLEKEEMQMKEMTKVTHEQIKMQREIAMKRAEAASLESRDAQVPARR
ncbi:uncharacterized protein C2845_PM15G08530 [Panicum miliaceum]|uniref:Uncharacterized protein n=1 Tax=Panicum miliaceum TaxID=4540 RepID=A0A3L6Q722_PANMI|nr:uncharacterized protein C2845_PM15G08530 [Panicum miliaceum]